MARGGVAKAVKAIEDKKRAYTESGDRQRKLFFRLKDGESAQVRFLEQGEELHWAWVHQVPSAYSEYGIKVPCRDQGTDGSPIGERCPGCERGDKRTFQGAINLIWRDAPVLQRDESNRIMRDSAGKPTTSGTEDQVAVWLQGITVFEQLEDLDESYSLTSRDFTIKRKGNGLSTRYTIMPAEERKLNKTEQTLVDKKYDLTEFVDAPPYDTWGKTFTQQKEETTTTPTRESPFRRSG